MSRDRIQILCELRLGEERFFQPILPQPCGIELLELVFGFCYLRSINEEPSITWLRWIHCGRASCLGFRDIGLEPSAVATHVSEPFWCGHHVLGDTLIDVSIRELVLLSITDYLKHVSSSATSTTTPSPNTKSKCPATYS